MRLDKYLAHAGYGTRKEVRNILKKQTVTVDNKIIKNGSKHIDPNTSVVTVNGEEVHYEKYVYLMLHKPPGYISATYDTDEKTVVDLVPPEYAHYHLFPVGRLDKDTEGLLLITNDGKLNHALTSPRREVYKMYYAIVEGRVEEQHKKQFFDGVTLDDGYQTKRAFLDIIKSDTISEVHLSICEGKFHQVKRMFKALQMKVTYLKRISIEKLYLDETLPIGHMRALTDDEIAYLRALK